MNDYVWLGFIGQQFTIKLELIDHDYVIVCPTAIAYSMAQIITSLRLCVSVPLSALPRSHFLYY